MPIVLIAVAVLVGIVLFVLGLVVAAVAIPLIGPYIRGKAAAVHCPLSRMIGMRLRGIQPGRVIDQMISLRRADVHASWDEFESHILAGGDLEDVVDAMIAATKAGLNVSFQKICAIDLAGRDVVRAVNACVNPIMINVPAHGQKYIAGVARDGIQLGVNVKVTARADIHKLVGGANEETIIARVGEGIVSTIGGAANHKDILENPNLISAKILSKGLDSQTAYEIVSIDVGDIEVLENIGAKLMEMQADADQMIAQARAEARRAMAVSQSRENVAKIREMRALEVLNRSQVPKDLARSYQRGNICRSAKPVHSVIHRNLWSSVRS